MASRSLAHFEPRSTTMSALRHKCYLSLVWMCVTACGRSGPEWLPVQAPPTDKRLLALHGLSSNDLYIAGESGLLMHFDGTNWKTLETQTVADFQSVFALNEKEVWVVGDLTVLFGNHRDGFTKTILSDIEKLTHVWSRSSEEVYIAGRVYNYIFKNSQFQIIKEVEGNRSPTAIVGGAIGFGETPEGIWMAKGNEVYLVTSGIAQQVDLGIAKYWSFLLVEKEGTKWLYSDVPPTGTLVRLSGKNLTSVTVPASTGGMAFSSQTLRQGFSIQAHNAWFVSKQGALLVWNGTQLEPTPDTSLLPNSMLNTSVFWGNSPDDMWAVGDEGQVYRRILSEDK